MSPSIPFLRLPPVPQLLILEYLGLFQLFDFSLLSKRTTQIAKSAKRNIKHLFWNADYENGWCTLDITDSEDNAFKIHVLIDIPRFNNNIIIIVGEITFEGRQLRTVRHEVNDLFIAEEDSSKEERLELFEKLTEHFLSVFNVESYSLWMKKAADLTKCVMWKHTKTLKDLSVDAYIPDKVLTAGDMEFVLGELTVTEKLTIHSKVARGFRWTEPLNTEHIVLRDCHFLSLDVFLNSEVKEWIINDRTFPTTHLNAIMKKWLDGGMEQLKHFEVRFSSNDRERRLNEALEGIQTFPWDGETRRRWYDWIEDPIDTSEGRDMRRSDGKLATAGIIPRHFYFSIWDSDHLQPELDSSDEDDEKDDEEDDEEDGD